MPIKKATITDTAILNKIEQINPDTLAQFYGGPEAYIKFLQNNLIYPQAALEKNIQGMVYVRFIVCEDGSICNVKVIDNGYSESYRQLLNSEPNEVAVVWFHDYMNNQYYRWENIQEFDRNKLVVFSCQRIDDTDKNNKYPMVSHIIYDDKDADEIEMDGSPKTGYHGPYIIFP